MTTPDTLIPAATYHGYILGLGGPAKCGKDTIGAAIGAEWRRAAFADALKDDLRAVLAIRLNLCPDADKDRVRPLLVEYGRLGREVRPSVWIDRLRVPMNAKRVVVTDTRYVNEAEFIQSKGGLVIYIDRPGTQPANAEEARSLHRLRFAPGVQTVVNDSTVDEAARQVLLRVRRHYGEVL